MQMFVCVCVHVCVCACVHLFLENEKAGAAAGSPTAQEVPCLTTETGDIPITAPQRKAAQLRERKMSAPPP